jgi:hypothetical protein
MQIGFFSAASALFQKYPADNENAAAPALEFFRKPRRVSYTESSPPIEMKQRRKQFYPRASQVFGA